MGICNYRECQNPEMELLGNNIEEEYHYLIVVTNSKVVYEKEYNSRKFKIQFGHETLHKVFGRGFFLTMTNFELLPMKYPTRYS